MDATSSGGFGLPGSSSPLLSEHPKPMQALLKGFTLFDSSWRFNVVVSGTLSASANTEDCGSTVALNVTAVDLKNIRRDLYDDTVSTSLLLPVDCIVIHARDSCKDELGIRKRKKEKALIGSTTALQAAEPFCKRSSSSPAKVSMFHLFFLGFFSYEILVIPRLMSSTVVARGS